MSPLARTFLSPARRPVSKSLALFTERPLKQLERLSRKMRRDLATLFEKHPSLMTAAERLAEISEILAAGFLRLRAREREATEVGRFSPSADLEGGGVRTRATPAIDHGAEAPAPGPTSFWMERKRNAV